MALHDPHQGLEVFQAARESFVGIDSDDCANPVVGRRNGIARVRIGCNWVQRFCRVSDGLYATCGARLLSTSKWSTEALTKLGPVSGRAGRAALALARSGSGEPESGVILEAPLGRRRGEKALNGTNQVDGRPGAG